MFGFPSLGGGPGGIIGGILIFGVFFVINLVFQLITGGLNDLFPTEMAMTM